MPTSSRFRRGHKTAQSRIAAVGRLLLAPLLIAPLWLTPVLAQDWFDLARYEELKRSDRATLEFVLAAMRESVFYAQESVGRPVICASPKPVSGSELIDLIGREIENPTNPMAAPYTKSDHVAFVLLNALKSAKACK